MITCKFEDGGDGALRHLVVHCLVLKEDKILLVKRAAGILEAGKWGFPGGFVDRDEKLEQCALRELMEETGYTGTVKGLFRINSNPNRRNDNGRQNVAHEILIEAGEKIGEPDWEQTAVEWKEINSLNEEMMAFDHFEAVQLLKVYINRKEEIPTFKLSINSV